jgi:hypothetical protein
VDRKRNVLHLPLAEVVEGHGNLAGDGLMHSAREADASGRGQSLQAGRDVDGRPQKVVMAFDHLAHRNPDAELQPPALGQGKVLGPHVILDLDRRAGRLQGAFELAHDRIAGHVEDAPATMDHEIVQDIAVGRELTERPILVLGDEPGEPDDVRSENGGDLPLHGRSSLGMKASGRSHDGTPHPGKMRPLDDFFTL